MKRFIFISLIIIAASFWGVVCALFTSSLTCWLEYDLFKIDESTFSLWPLAFAPFFMLANVLLYYAGFLGALYVCRQIAAAAAVVRGWLALNK